MQGLQFCRDVYARRGKEHKQTRPASRQARKDAESSRHAFVQRRRRGGDILQLVPAR